MRTRYVVDTTILVSWLLDPSKLTGRIVRSLELELFTPYKAVDELWKHQRDWSRRRPNIDLQRFMDSIAYYVKIEMVDQDSGEMKEASSMMERIDPDDSEFVALALKLNATIWSHDKHFLEQNRVEVFSSRNILRQSTELPSLWAALNDQSPRAAISREHEETPTAANERERRLQILATWWREQMKERIDEYLKGHDYEIKNARHLISRKESVVVHGFEFGTAERWRDSVRSEAQKRWAVSRVTANDYAAVVFEATWPEMIRLTEKTATDMAGQSA